jgi:chemotaxis protein CheX
MAVKSKHDKPNVLIVDDEPQMVDVLKNFIEDVYPQFKVYTASDGKRALNFVESVRFEFVLLDYNLPVYKGNQIIEEIQFLDRRFRPKGVFLITGENLDTLKIQTNKVTTKFFSKPVDFNSLEGAINNVLNPQKTAPKKKGRVKLDVEFMNPFINSTLKVLEITCQTQAKKEEVALKKEPGFAGEVSAYYPIESHLFTGFFSVSFKKDTYLKIVSQMLMEEHTEVNDENKDGVAELCNQIFGNAKAEFSGNAASGLKMQKPAVYTTQDSDDHNLGPRICIRFSSDKGEFFIETAVRKLK